MKIKYKYFVLGCVCFLVASVNANVVMDFEMLEDLWVTEADLSEFDLSDLWCEYKDPGSYETLRNSGIERSSTVVKNGNYSCKWKKHNEYPTMWTDQVETDWSMYDMISFWVYSEVATNEVVFLAVHSDSVSTLWKDFFVTGFNVNWTGWKKFEIPFTSFEVYEDVTGWSKIDGIYFYTKIFNKQPNPYTVLYFDYMQLGCNSMEADINRDCQVDWSDMIAFASGWLNNSCVADDWCGGADINKSTFVDMVDFSEFSGQF